MKMLFLLMTPCAVAFLSAPAQAQQQCDCTKIVGSCVGSVRVKSVTGSPPSVSMSYVVTSTAPSCSKVSYYIDGTPYFNVLRNGNSEEDSAFGTKMPTLATFSEVACEVCTKTGDGANLAEGAKTDSVKQDPKNSFDGRWITEHYTLTITSSASQSPQMHAVFTDPPQEYRTAGAIDGNTLSFSWSMGMFGSNSCRFTVTGPATATANCSNFTGQHTLHYRRQ